MVTTTLAALVDIEIWRSSRSIGTLTIFGAVCAGLLARRHTPEDGTGAGPRREGSRRWWRRASGFPSRTPRGARGGREGNRARISPPRRRLVFFFAAIVASTLSFNTIPRHNAPRRGFETPLVPYLPAAGVMATAQLVASLGPPAWARFAAYTVACALGYAWFGVAGIVGGWGPSGTGWR